MEEERRGKQEQYEGVLGLSEYIVRVCWDYLSILCHFHVTEWFLYNLQVFLSCLSQGVGLCTQVGAECTQVGAGLCTQVGAVYSGRGRAVYSGRGRAVYSGRGRAVYSGRGRAVYSGRGSVLR